MKSGCKKYKSFTYEVCFANSACVIEVREEGKGKIYQGKFNQEAIPGEYQMFVDPENLYDVMSSNPEAVEIQDPLRVEVFWPTGKTNRKLIFPLKQKMEPKEDENREESALREVKGLIEELSKTKMQLNLAKAQQKMKEEEIQALMSQLHEERSKCMSLEKDNSILREMETQMDHLKGELIHMDETIKELSSQDQQVTPKKSYVSPHLFQSRSTVLSGSRVLPQFKEEGQMKLMSDSLIFERQIEEKQLFGCHMKTKFSLDPMKRFNYNGSTLARSSSGFIRQEKEKPRIKPTDYTKFVCKFGTEGPVFKVGLVWNNLKDLKAIEEFCSNSHGSSSIYYDCSKMQNPKIKHKGIQVEGFQVEAGKQIVMVLDWSEEETRWYVQGQLKSKVPLAPQLFEQGVKIYCFVQMENNGNVITAL